MQTDIWKEIKDFEGYYIINKDGVIMGVDREIPDIRVGRRRIRGQVLCTYKNKDGYIRCQLWKGKKANNLFIHRLLAETFIENIYQKQDVNHKNGIRYDNRLENLEWMTRSENVQHGYRSNGRKPTRYWLGKGGDIRHFCKKVECVTTGIIYRSVTEAAIDLGIDFRVVSAVCLNKRKSVMNMKFKFV